MWVTVLWLGQWDQDLSLVRELSFWEPILYVDTLLSLDTVGRAFFLPQVMWETLLTLNGLGECGVIRRSEGRGNWVWYVKKKWFFKNFKKVKGSPLNLFWYSYWSWELNDEKYVISHTNLDIKILQIIAAKWEDWIWRESNWCRFQLKTVWLGKHH